MINSLFGLLGLTYFKLLMEDSLIIILMSMEMVSMLMFFLLMSLNLESTSLTHWVVTTLSILISEGVLSLSIFVNLIRVSSSEKVSSLMLSH